MVKGALQTVNLEVLVSKKRKKVAFVEAGKEFIDVLFSFMTMPVGMIIGSLTLDNLLKNEMGCLKNLYNSVEKLDEDFLQTANCKDMLLRPRSAVEIHYSKLKLDLVNSSNNEYFVCEDGACDLVSLYQTANCNCGRPFKYRMKLSENQSSVLQDGGVFVKPTTCIMIDDNFRIEPVSIKHGYKLLEELQLTSESRVERRTANMGRDEIMVKGALQSVKVLVSEETKQVVFVEAGQEFIDVLLSFITMPIGMIIRSLIHDNLLKNEMGCLKNLYHSVEKLDENYLQSAMCKDMLLCPRSAAEIHYRKLDLDLVDSSSNQYYACEYQGCDFVSFYQTDHCHCGRAFKYRMKLSENQSSAPQDGGVFVKPTTRIMIDDKFRVHRGSTEDSFKLLRELQLTSESTEERWIENIGRAEVLKLMVCSLVSKTPFSDIFINNPPDRSNYHGKYDPRRPHLSQRVADNSSDNIQISLKLFIDKRNNKLLYAEAGEDFVDLLFSFLTIPLGYFFKKFPKLPFQGSLRNLYNNIQNLGDSWFFKSTEMKETLVNPKLAPGLAQHNQLIDLDEAPNPTRKTLSSNFKINRSLLSANTNHHDVNTGEGFVKGPSKFMVKNNLSVTLFSPGEVLTLMGKKNLREVDIKELNVIVDKDKALHLLAASLVSESALTDVFILNKPTVRQSQGRNVDDNDDDNDEDDDDCCCCCCPF